MDSLISFCLLVKSEGYFFPFPFLHLFSEMLKHLAASEQGHTANTWVLGDFSPPLSFLSSAAAGQNVLNGTFSPWLPFHQKQPLALMAWFKGSLLRCWPDYLMMKWCGAMTLRHDVMGLDVSPEEIQASWCWNCITRWFLFPVCWFKGREGTYPIHSSPLRPPRALILLGAPVQCGYWHSQPCGVGGLDVP